MPQPHRVVLAEGKFLRLVVAGGYEYVERTRLTGIVVIVALTGDGRLVLTEQLRRPLGKHVIELPAGLAGDEPGGEHEPLQEAARRELLEETGYQADEFVRVAEGTTSAGLCSELVTVFRAVGLRKAASGGGVGQENIRVHEVPLAELPSWLAERERQGLLIDLKVYAASCWAAAASR